MRELMARKEFFAGLDPNGKEYFPKPYRRSLKEMGEVRFAAEMGRLCEEKVLGLWSGNLVVSDNLRNRVEKPYRRILKRIGRRYKKTLTSEELMNVTRKVVHYKYGDLDENWRPYIHFKNRDFRTLVKNLDQALGAKLIAAFEKVASSYGFINREMAYFLNTALVLAREVVEPSFQMGSEVSQNALHFPGKLIPNVKFSFDGKGGQFDGILVPEGTPTDNFDLVSYLKGGGTWAQVETKVPFRSREVSGNRKISKKPYPWHIEEVQQRMGKLFLGLGLTGRKNEAHYLPSMLIICYLRGVLPAAVHIVPINHIFMENWKEKVDFSIHPTDANGEELDSTEAQRIQEQLIEVPYVICPALWGFTETTGKMEKKTKKGGVRSKKKIAGTQVGFGWEEKELETNKPKEKEIQEGEVKKRPRRKRKVQGRFEF
jgi:hypothetical protein